MRIIQGHCLIFSYHAQTSHPSNQQASSPHFTYPPPSRFPSCFRARLLFPRPAFLFTAAFFPALPVSFSLSQSSHLSPYISHCYCTNHLSLFFHPISYSSLPLSTTTSHTTLSKEPHVVERVRVRLHGAIFCCVWVPWGRVGVSIGSGVEADPFFFEPYI